MVPLSASSRCLIGNGVGSGMKAGNLEADKKNPKNPNKLNWIFFCYVDSFVDGFDFNHPFLLENSYKRDFQKSDLF